MTPPIATRFARLGLAALFGTALVASAGAATGGKAGLAAEADINDGLLVLAVADKIRRECDAISARFFRANGYANELRSLAEARGYSRAEVDAYIADDAEEAKMRQRRDAYFTARGASSLDPESLCALGRSEIAGGTPIGRLLTAK